MIRYLTQEREEKQKKRKGTAAVCNKEGVDTPELGRQHLLQNTKT
jgi:hypothetical protein